jgi:hypothetical protein
LRIDAIVSTGAAFMPSTLSNALLSSPSSTHQEITPMRSSTKIALFAMACLLAPGTRTAAAQVGIPPDSATMAARPVTAPRPAGPIVRRWGFDLVTGAIDGTAAEQAGTGSRLWGAQVSLGITAHRVLTVTGDFGIVGMSDEAAFTQETNQGSKTSGVAAGMGSLALGLRTPPLSLGARDAAISAGASAGATWLHVTRTITNCSNCHGEDVELGAGTFVEPGVHLTSGRRGISARYRLYGGGSDVQDALMIGLTGTF